MAGRMKKGCDDIDRRKQNARNRKEMGNEGDPDYTREEEDNLEEGFEGDRFLGSAGTLVDTLHATLEEKQQLRNAFRPR
jgi:hypothetical protein